MEQITKQGDDTSSALMAVCDSIKVMTNTSSQVVENIKGMNKWAPTIDNSLQALHQSLEEVSTRVAIMEAYEAMTNSQFQMRKLQMKSNVSWPK
jgi:5'-3' exonuclease